MEKNRLETFSEGVIAIIITTIVLELKVRHGERLESFSQLYPKLFYIAIVWFIPDRMIEKTFHA